MNSLKIPDSLIGYLALLKEKGVPEEHFQHYIGDYLELSAREKGIPLHGSFELTPLCNFDCKMCYVHLNNYQFSKEQLIDVATWKKLITDAFESGMRNASLTGGECLTYPGFDDVYLFLYEMGIRIGVLTNGVLLDKDRIDFFRKYRPRMIQVTLYGSNDKAYETVTGKKAFDTVINNIQRVRDSNLPIKIAITPSSYMLGDIENTLDVVEGLQVPYYINSFLSMPRDNTGRDKADLTVDQYISVYRKRNALKNWEDLYCIDPAELPEAGKNQKEKRGLRCGAGRSTFTIRYDGIMSPCVSMSYIELNPLQLGFRQSWQQMNEIVNSYMLPAECEDCFYSSVCLKCVTLHKNAPQGHCNTQICERTKKMISEGILPLPKH